MESIWTSAKVDELEFAATSHLLGKHANKLSITPAEQLNDVSGDEDEYEEDDGDYITSRPSSNLATPQQDALIDKFLDRLAELFSREKSSPGCRSRKGSKHIAATAWINPDHESEEALTVIVAKNEGLDVCDVKMMAGLQSWLRDVAASGTVGSAQNDTLWVGNEGFVEFSRNRLWYHISWLKENDGKVTSLTTSSAENTARLTKLQRLCQDISYDSATQHLSEIIHVAYDLRSAWKARPVPGEHMKAIRTVNMLGRLRAAYECFISAALTFGTLAGLEMKPVSLRLDVRRKVNFSRRRLQRILTECNLPTDILQDKTKNTVKSQLHVYAEMQILMDLAQNPDWHRRAHSYIGVSKKLCFLCDKILKNYGTLSEPCTRKPAFRARQRNGKTYPLWTLPECKDLPCVSKSSLVMAVTCTYDQMRHELQQKLHLRPARAESSAGVTSIGSLCAEFTLQRDQYLKGQRPSHSPKTAHESGRASGIGCKIKTVEVGCLPADGSDAKLVKIVFHALSKAAGVKMFESEQEYVPDFHDFWHEHQFDRRYRDITLKGQANKDWNGEYRLYWNENHALLDNGTIKILLGIEKVETMRRFWYGDVFIIRFSEHSKTSKFDVYDLPFSVPECHVVLKQIFRHMWENEFLEAQLQRDRYTEEHLAKVEADKHITLQRMTPLEREVLNHMPPNMLEYLAITDCDDSAARDHEFEKVPGDPSMVQIRYMEKRSALDSSGWTGFSSDQL